MESNIDKRVRIVYAGVNVNDKIGQRLKGECERSILLQGGPHDWRDVECYRRLATKSIACVSHTLQRFSQFIPCMNTSNKLTSLPM